MGRGARPRPEPEDIPLSVIFENDDVIVVDKPQGMVVHPGSGNRGGTLVNALLFHCRGWPRSSRRTIHARASFTGWTRTPRG